MKIATLIKFTKLRSLPAKNDNNFCILLKLFLLNKSPYIFIAFSPWSDRELFRAQNYGFFGKCKWIKKVIT
jgi:hypothetical protein